MPILSKIKECREKEQMTQQSLADATGVSRQTINAIETGKYEPSLGLALKLAKYFNVRIEELFVLK